MGKVPDSPPRLHPQIKREIAEAWWAAEVASMERRGFLKLPPSADARLEDSDVDWALCERFGASTWARLEPHLAKLYAARTTIAAPSARRSPRLPMPSGFVPWRRIGGPEVGYPDPRYCSEIEGLLAFGVYWPLQKLGVPLDFKYPDDSPERTAREVGVYERSKIRPLLSKARRLTALLERTAVALVEAEKANPRYRDLWGGSGPRLESSRLATFDSLRTAAQWAGGLLPRPPRQKSGPKKAHSKDELVRRLKAVGLPDVAIAEAMKLLGLEGAGDAAQRISRRRRRLTI